MLTLRRARPFVGQPIMPLSSHIRPEPNPPLDRARVIRAREMYAEGFTVSRILAHCQMSLGTLYACLDGVPFGAGRRAHGAGSATASGHRQAAARAQGRRCLAGQPLLRTAERQVRDIETRLSARDAAPVERERDVRMLMSLTRALRDLAALRKQSARRSRFRYNDRRRWRGDDPRQHRCAAPGTVAAAVRDGGWRRGTGRRTAETRHS